MVNSRTEESNFSYIWPHQTNQIYRKSFNRNSDSPWNPWACEILWVHVNGWMIQLLLNDVKWIVMDPKFCYVLTEAESLASILSLQLERDKESTVTNQMPETKLSNHLLCTRRPRLRKDVPTLPQIARPLKEITTLDSIFMHHGYLSTKWFYKFMVIYYLIHVHRMIIPLVHVTFTYHITPHNMHYDAVPPWLRARHCGS